MSKTLQEEILAALATREERVPFNGETLVVRELESAADTAAFQDDTDLAYKLLVRCVFDEAGNQVFTDQQIPALKKASKTKLAPITRAVNRVNGFDADDSAKKDAAAPA